MGGTLTAEGLGQLLESLPPYELTLAIKLLRNEQAAQGLTVPKLAKIATQAARPARIEIDKYRDQVQEMEKKLITLEPTTATTEVPEFGL